MKINLAFLEIFGMENKDNVSSASGVKKETSILEINENIKKCFIIKKDFSRSVLPIYREMHKIIGTIRKENKNYYLSSVITLSEENGIVCINNIQLEVMTEFYNNRTITEVKLEDYTEIEEFYLGTITTLFKRLDDKITEQLARKNK